MQLKLITIGNSKGIRIPKKLIEKYHLRDNLVIEERDGGILVKGKDEENKLSWEDTFKEAARSDESWEDLDFLAGEGIE